MSNFRFGANDYKLSYYPPEASDGIGGVDWDKVESVEIEFDEYVKVVRCRDCVAYEPYHTYAGMKLDYGECTQHRRQTDDDRFCWWAERSDR